MSSRRTTRRAGSWAAVTLVATLLGALLGAVPASAHDDTGSGSAESAAAHAREDLAGVSVSTIEQKTAAAAADRTPQERRAAQQGLQRARAEAAPSAAADRGVAGAWSAPVATPLVPVFQAVLPDGKVLMWDSVGDGAVEQYPGPQNFTRAMVWDPATNRSTDVRLNGYNIFCAGYTQLPNGDVLVVGGNKNANTDPIRQTHVFHWRTETWTRGPDMAEERWYPSVAALADGEAVIVGGGTDMAEVYQNDGTLRSLSGLQTFSDRTYYPMLVPREDGRLEVVGPGPLATVDTHGAGVLDASRDRDGIDRTYGSFATFLPGQTLVTGGGDIRGSNGTRQPSASSVVVDTTGGTTSVRPARSMAFPRRQHNLTLLADGSALATGGMSRAESGYVDLAHPVLAAERWVPGADPASGTWTTLAAASKVRQYHSSASLLPDGRVLTGGGGVCGVCVEAGYLEKNVEYFSPPYLFNPDGSPAARPDLRNAPAAVTIGDTFTATSPQATVPQDRAIRKLALVRLGAPTHGVDQGQRYVPLRFSATGNTLTVQAPASAATAPPGYYMLFAVDAAGVPSVASMVQVRSDLAPPTVDLARGRAAVQSSTFDEADGSATGAAAHAVDGNTDGRWKGPANTVTHTALQGDDHPWWQVDLAASSTVQGVELWNRTDCCRERLTGSVFLSATDMRDRTYAQLRGDPTVTELPLTPGSRANVSLRVRGVQAQFVRVQPAEASPLHLAEVRVLGSGPPPTTENRPPTAVADVARTARGGRTVRLVGTRSSDPDGDRLTYRWSQTSGPKVRLAGGTTARPTFVAPRKGGTLRFALRVNDGLRDSAADTAEVSVAPLVDLASGRPARQSTTVGGGRAARAVDGRTDGRWGRHSVTRTAVQRQPWWQVDLGVARDLDVVRVWNRSDCCGAQLRGARVFLSKRSMAGRSWAALVRDPRVTERRITAARKSTVPGARARYVRVQSPRRTSLALAEVQAFGWRS